MAFCRITAIFRSLCPLDVTDDPGAPSHHILGALFEECAAGLLRYFLLLIGQHVRVGAQRDGDVGVADTLGDGLDVAGFAQRQRDVRLRTTGDEIDAGQHDGAAEGSEGMDGLAKEQPGQPGGEDRLAQEADRDDGGIQVP